MIAAFVWAVCRRAEAVSLELPALTAPAAVEALAKTIDYGDEENQKPPPST